MNESSFKHLYFKVFFSVLALFGLMQFILESFSESQAWILHQHQFGLSMSSQWTSGWVHINLSHALGNIVFLALCLPILEKKWGVIKTFSFVLICSWLTFALELWVYHGEEMAPSCGASMWGYAILPMSLCLSYHDPWFKNERMVVPLYILILLEESGKWWGHTWDISDELHGLGLSLGVVMVVIKYGIVDKLERWSKQRINR